MKALKITLLLVAVLLLTVSVVHNKKTETVEDPVYKEYSPKDLLAVEKKKFKVHTQG